MHLACGFALLCTVGFLNQDTTICSGGPLERRSPGDDIRRRVPGGGATVYVELCRGSDDLGWVVRRGLFVEYVMVIVGNTCTKEPKWTCRECRLSGPFCDVNT